ANLERAVVAAVARADAAVVYLAVESVGSVIRGEHRADGLTRRVVTVLAHHRSEACLERLAILAALPVALDAHPAHLAAAEDLLLTDGGDVVLRVARGDTRRTAGAAREVDRHAPLGQVVASVVAEFPLLLLRLVPAVDCLEFPLGVHLVRWMTHCSHRLLGGHPCGRVSQRHRLDDAPT